ncbi:tetratricopeptide repeat protein [Actinacidiphila sp. ITFR-21]|uniref:tetratricopeptide repeat protein n=1 Tax=Actinacidiphila sp. ITFR-21 TaxID=3075199 RepID=UPI00288B7406|nr:tetratricopeptide repeat protein [Streptomyces sp. ITFR-21]WNI14357.1 tetratricopeptide repeat protein [Streptomyces sp. ITFR-21]
MPEAPWQRVRVGNVPPLASAFQPRLGLRAQIDRARAEHATVVLAQVFSGGGGVGKSQLAAAYARQAHTEGVDVLVWVDAAETAQIVAAYARAAQRVEAPGAGGQDLEDDARAFLDWLAGTERSWLVVLDDLTDLEGARPWWPRPPAGDNGRVLATTRRRDALVSGAGRTVVDVGTYTRHEARAYLHDRFTGTRTPHLMDDRAGDLTFALGHLPLALGHAAAYMVNEDVPCSVYLRRFTDRSARLDTLLPPGADTDGYGRHVTASLLLALDAVRQHDPTGTAAPAIRLAAHLDPAGHPQELWSTTALTDYLTHHRTPAPPTADPPDRATPEQTRTALRLLHRYGLLTWDSPAGPRAVRMHALTARAARETTPAAETPATVRALADALVDIWPASEHTASDTAAVLRANTDTLAANSGDLLWQPDGHPVLFQAGTSLLNSGLYAAAVTYWHHVAADSQRLLGEDHPDTLTARSNLALSYGQAGRTTDAITLQEQLATDSRRLLGEDHLQNLAARSNLALSYWQAGRTTDAILIEEQVAADSERLLGEDHHQNLAARGNLALSYWQAGRTTDAITLQEQVATDSQRLLGENHPNTLTARGNLATSYGQAGRTTDAILIEEQVAADRARLLGEDHPDTLTARGNLAASYRQAGRTTDAITLQEQVATDSQRLLGEDHPNTLKARGNLAASYWQVGRTTDAILIEEQVAADRARLLGEDHPNTLTARSNLAASYWQAGRTTDAITLQEQVTTDSQRLLGEDHPNTVAEVAALHAWRRALKPWWRRFG